MENKPKKKDVFSFSNGADIDIDVKMKVKVSTGLVIVGSSDYISKVERHIADLGCTLYGAKLLKKIMGSPKDIVIYKGGDRDNSFRSYIAETDDKYYIRFDPDDYSKYDEGLIKFPPATLAHEMYHQQDWDKYLKNKQTYMSPEIKVVRKETPHKDGGWRSINNTEIEAVHVENIIRSSWKKETRKKYSKFNVFNQKRSNKQQIFESPDADILGDGYFYCFSNRNFDYKTVPLHSSNNIPLFNKGLKKKTVNPEKYEFVDLKRNKDLNKKSYDVKFNENDKALLLFY